MARAVIFDMDGTLANNDPAHSRAWELLLTEHGVTVEPTDKGVVHIPGQTTHQNSEIFKKRYQLKPPIEELVARKKVIYQELFKTHIELTTGAKALLEHLHKRGVKKAVASGSSKETIITTLSHLGIDGHFGALVSAQEVGYDKPDPRVFLHAAYALGVPPEDCVVIGDTAPDIMGAAAAGMPSVFIPNPYMDHDPNLEPTLQVTSMAELSWTELAQL